MRQFAATVEKAGDGTWTAAILGRHAALGTGSTREEAVNDLREGMRGLIEYLKESGQEIPSPEIEVISIEVAA